MRDFFNLATTKPSAPASTSLLRPDMEFGTHFILTEVFRTDFTPKYIVNYVSFLAKKTVGVRKKTMFYPYFTQNFLPYTHLYHCFPQFYFIGPIKLNKKCLTLQQQMNLQQTA